MGETQEQQPTTSSERAILAPQDTVNGFSADHVAADIARYKADHPDQFQTKTPSEVTAKPAVEQTNAAQAAELTVIHPKSVPDTSSMDNVQRFNVREMQREALANQQTVISQEVAQPKVDTANVPAEVGMVRRWINRIMGK